MANLWAGEVSLVIDGTTHPMKLTLGALAELEAALDVGGLVDLVERFEAQRFSSRDVLALIVAGLRGAGSTMATKDMLSAEIEGGPMAAAKAAAELLVRAFTVPDQ
jgi:hypothetical protein